MKLSFFFNNKWYSTQSKVIPIRTFYNGKIKYEYQLKEGKKIGTLKIEKKLDSN